MIEHLNDEETVGIFFQKELQGTNQTEFRIEKERKKKDNNLCVKWKVMVIWLIATSIKNISLHKMSFYAEPDSYSKNKIKIESHFPNYATKSEVKKQQVLIH